MIEGGKFVDCLLIPILSSTSSSSLWRHIQQIVYKLHLTFKGKIKTNWKGKTLEANVSPAKDLKIIF